MQVLPLASEFLELLLRANLMFFYFEGLYYHILKHSAGIRYLFIGKLVVKYCCLMQVLPLASEFLELLLRANLMFFYFEGLYYHILKHSAGIRYLFIGKPMYQRPRYQMLGMFLLVQLCNIAAEGLRRSNLASIAT
ncbi:Peroxisome biogenesis factor 10 [Artemisia annua]|uniref:RING-type E3 ubiquitin transferase n=1 Tax=Artemisia annua TaxID=35608 RepID=A0A2U1N9R7_ARTAN|nr:Peroxisome biogenesis factor 10 [Artemisia annua]